MAPAVTTTGQTAPAVRAYRLSPQRHGAQTRANTGPPLRAGGLLDRLANLYEIRGCAAAQSAEASSRQRRSGSGPAQAQTSITRRAAARVSASAASAADDARSARGCLSASCSAAPDKSGSAQALSSAPQVRTVIHRPDAIAWPPVNPFPCRLIGAQPPPRRAPCSAQTRPQRPADDRGRDHRKPPPPPFKKSDHCLPPFCPLRMWRR